MLVKLDVIKKITTRLVFYKCATIFFYGVIRHNTQYVALKRALHSLKLETFGLFTWFLSFQVDSEEKHFP